MYDTEFTSTSATQLSDLLPVDISPEWQKTAEAVLYPSPKAKRGAQLSPAYLREVFMYLGCTSAIAELVMQQARYMYTRVPTILDSGGTLDECKSALANNLAYSNSIYQTAMTAIISGVVPSMGLNSGGNYVISKSKRYAGGMDIVFSGYPSRRRNGQSTVIVTPLADLASLHGDWDEPAQTESYTLALMTSVQIAHIVRDWLYGKTVTVDAAARSVEQVGLNEVNWSVADLLTRVDAVCEKAGFGRMFAESGFTYDEADHLFPSTYRTAAEPLLSYCLVREVNHEALSAAEKETVVGDPTVGLGEAITQLQTSIGLSIALNLPAEVSNYITQTEKGKNVSLYSLNLWAAMWSTSLLTPKGKRKKGAPRRVWPHRLPRYVTKPSSLDAMAAYREKLGFSVDAGRSDESGIFIAPNGRLNYCPNQKDGNLENATKLEALQEEALALCYERGLPFSSVTSGWADGAAVSQEDVTALRSLKSKMSRFAGSLQVYSWDLNAILTVSASEPGKLMPKPLAGATKVDILTQGAVLTQPARTGLVSMFPDVMDVETGKAMDDIYDNHSLCSSSLIMLPFSTQYPYLLMKGLVPDAQTLVDRAVKALGYKSLDASTLDEYSPERYDVDLYNGKRSRSAAMYDNFKLAPNFVFNAPEKREYDFSVDADKIAATTAATAYTNQGAAIVSLFYAAMIDASARPGSNLLRIAVKEGIDPNDDSHFFDAGSSNVAAMGNVYNYLGGRVFYEAMLAMSKVDLAGMTTIDPADPLRPAPFTTTSTLIRPFVELAAKYVPEADRIIEEATEARHALEPDESVEPGEDFSLPGSKEGFSMFPHQIKAMRVLGGKTPPRFALLDIAPGGGKTLLGLTDIGNLIRRKLIKRPLVLAPNGLVRNWIEDMHMVTEGKWNLIPLTTQTMATWGEERLTAMIQKAPPNTIVVAGLSMLRLGQMQMVIGNHVERVTAMVEFCKRFGFDYVILDESHKGKNSYSQTHRSIKKLTTGSTMKYVRLATGTFVQTKLTDVVGQTALMTSSVFRTVEEFIQENSVEGGGGRALAFGPNTAYEARAKLGSNVAVISAKKKDWAFMLPRPLETFLAVSLENQDPNTSDPLGQAHQMMYQAVLAETMSLLMEDPTIKKLLAGKGEDGDDPESDEDEGTEGEAAAASGVAGSGGKLAGMTLGAQDLDESAMGALEEALRPYLQRLEMLLTDPMGDPQAGEFFAMHGVTKYVSRKVKKIIERIRLNFDERPWVKGANYVLKSLVDYDGEQYVLMGEPGKKLTLEDYSEAAAYKSVLTPDKDPRWVPEKRGKVLVFCRYTRSVTAIYEALPPDLKKIALPFSDATGDKWANLEAFRTTPYSKTRGVQILVANEQAISEGHNLQMASRIVRVEAPWSPGELDQTASRIFRPDPSGANRRENVYLDWVMCNNTLEVAKTGRLVSRTIDKVKFDEALNPLYDEMADWDLAPISMSLDTIMANPKMEDISDYISANIRMAHIQREEFEHMRETQVSSMTPVGTSPMPEGSQIIDLVPYVSGLKSVPDRHNFGLVKLATWLQDETPDAATAINDPKTLVGQYVHTEMGNGVITSVRTARGDGTKITSVVVRLVNGDTYTGDPSMIYLATKLTKETVGNFSPKASMVTKDDKAKAAKAEKLREKERRAAEKELKKTATGIKRRKVAEEVLTETVKRTKKDTSAAAKQRIVRQKRAIKEELEEADPLTLDLYPVVYNSLLAVEATPGEDDAKDMKKLGFKDFGNYAYVQIKDKVSFDAMLNWLESKFYLKRQTWDRLESLAEHFVSGRGRKFAVEIAPLPELKQFYLIAHKLSQKNAASGKMELKIYPVIINGNMFLNVDLSTNPTFRRQLGKVIPGTRSLKFQEADGLWIQFFPNLSSVSAWTRTVKQYGAEITNPEEFKESVLELKARLQQMRKLAK